MLWRRKKKEEGTHEMRRFYRRAPGKKHSLVVKLRPERGPAVTGELIDVSAGGAAVSFRSTSDPKLAPGARAVLTFGSLSRSGEIAAQVQVASRSEIEGGARYGFQFTDLEALFAQIDNYFVKFFNRRRSVRVRPALDTKITTQVITPIGTLDAPLTDVSIDGFGVLLDGERAKLVQGIERLELQFTVPKVKVDVRWSARAVHVSTVARGTVLGGEFLPQPKAELERERATLTEYCSARLAEMAKWDSAFD